MLGAGGGFAGSVCGVGRGAEQSVHIGRAATRSLLEMGRDELRVEWLFRGIGGRGYVCVCASEELLEFQGKLMF